ncbi:hypothetical protein [uncultured Paludibaculum sp.]|uniref:hypothetical protein n=1 Tax=uncultured Paludibaculum sp. TaxID=1765020 RepID=UPI00374DA299
MLACIPRVSSGQTPAQPTAIESIKESFDRKHWQRVVDLARGQPTGDADIDYYQGVALAQLGQWEAARTILLRGRGLWPRDARFPVELGGVTFKLKRYAEAARWLRRGLYLNPGDAYAIDFLATIYYLQGNLEAALEYWNRIGKPRIGGVQLEPALRLDPVLLDSAFTFAHGGTLSLSDLLTTRARVRGLGIYPSFDLRLNARQDGAFDVAFNAIERNGWGKSTVEGVISTLRGIGYQTVFPEYFNAGGSAINVTSLVRWDAQKRRLMAGVSAPLSGGSRYRFQAGVDGRNENWDLRPSFTGPAPILGSLNLRRTAVSGNVTSFRAGGWSWSTGTELSHRDYRNVSAGPGLPREVLLEGYQLKSITQLDHDLWRMPIHRFESRAHVSSETARIWSAPAHAFERLQGSVTSLWLPQMSGDDYAISQQFSAGRIFGRAPFDELYMLGLERDNDLWMRAHIGTRGGRKGSAPLGQNYFVSNWEMDKKIYSGIFGIKLSPFLDTGKSTDSLPGLGSGKWLWDTGVQAKIRVLGVGFRVVYGKDLRSGNNAFYLMAGR